MTLLLLKGFVAIDKLFIFNRTNKFTYFIYTATITDIEIKIRYSVGVSVT